MNDTIFEHSASQLTSANHHGKNSVNPWQPYDYLIEKERTVDGVVEKVAIVFLTNKECPFHCLMCDLWKNTTNERVPDRAIPLQIQWALSRLSTAEHIKLYNSGSFFDVHAIPPSDFPSIAKQLEHFKTVTVECHPLFIRNNCLEFSKMLRPELYVAMGLETVHPDVLPNLNKGMTLSDFEHATYYLNQNGIMVRAFILLKPPFLNESDGKLWAKKSIDYAFSVGVECCVIIPTRGGNGTLDRFQQKGLFSLPRIESLEEVLEYGVRQKRGRVFADLWDVEKFSACTKCKEHRIQRMRSLNFNQLVPLPVECRFCGDL